MAQQASQAGRVLNGRYRLEEKLGEGGMGQIWRGEHLILKAPIAVKLVDREAIPDDETLSRFIREAQAAAAIRSPHVVQILDYGTDDKVPFMVMELLDGETLAQRLRREKRLGPQDTARVITHIARAVGRAHEEGIVHRDLKPENVFLVKNDDEELAKVLDFGVAKIENDSLNVGGTRTRTGSILGTPYYMSPEQAQGNKAVDFRSDLWSMAVIAFECLTGKRPFYSDGLGDLVLQICIRDIVVPSRVAAVPLGFDDWFKRGTQREPERRFQSARELVEALRDALGIEARETLFGPEVLVTTGGGASDAPPSLQPSSRSEAVTELARPSQVPRLSGEAIRSARGERTGASGDAGDDDLESELAEADADSLSSPGDDDREHGSDRELTPALTVQQFGTTTHSSVPPPRSSSTIVWGVAGLALGLGVMIGFYVVSRGDSGERGVVLTPNNVDVGAASPASPLRRADQLAPVPSATASAMPSAASSAPEAHESAGHDKQNPDAGAEDSVDEQPDAAAPADAGSDGWVKPDWARPDDEEEVAPEPTEPPTPPRATPKENPY